MPRKRTSRLFTRSQGGEVRYYGDFRDFADVGGGKEALRAPDEKNATTSLDIATELAAARLRMLERARRGKTLIGVKREASLAHFAAEHLRKKARGIKRGTITTQWMQVTEKHLETAIAYFSSVGIIDVAEIGVDEVREYAVWLEDLPNGRGGVISGGTQRHYLNALSNLFERAQSAGLVPLGHNPVAKLEDEYRPSAGQGEAAWMEIPAATLYLEAARTYVPKRGDISNPAAYEIIATFLLTGCREKEVYGLDVEDLSFDRKIIRIRPNKWRRLKTKTSQRIIHMWPQLEEILRPYVFGGDSPRSGLLFPSPKTGKMVTDLRKTLDAIGDRLSYEKGEVRTKMFRHTYCAARLQTLDRGAPVSQYMVGKELGHGGDELVKRVYGHLGTIGQRSGVIEYRPEHYWEEMGEEIADLRAGV